MQEELNQFERNEVCNLVERPKDYSIIETKWVYRNKLDENGLVIRNKARLVAKGYNQEKKMILMKPLHQLLDQRLLGYCLFMLVS